MAATPSPISKKKSTAKKIVAKSPAPKVKASTKITTAATAKKTSVTKTESKPKPRKAIATKPEKTGSKAPKAAVVKKVPGKSKREITVSPEQRYLMIATAAYYLAECRGFNGGYAMEDWLTAEREIDAKIKS